MSGGLAGGVFPVSGSCDFSCVLEAVGTPPFVVLGVVAQGLLRGISASTLCGGACNISASSEFFEDISKVTVA